MHPDMNSQSVLINQYHRQCIREAVQHQRLVDSLPRRPGRIDVLIAHLGRGMVALGQRLQQRPADRIDPESLTYPAPAFDTR